MTFGDKIRKLRIEKKMTQQKLGAMVGVSYRTIRSWEVEGRYLNNPVSVSLLSGDRKPQIRF
ncbi:MAG: helix-turn-helix transcriptional regulator [Anaerobutyricum hallii]